ncbi:hypothetical protein BK784_09585 [Bacillus thuringiensis serovar medellin]|uniref:Uncharacterized protein n=1 Tax=Bacillus thuringiensis subsp. medellin TaxID=79672 RepID=A0A9X6RHN4_BACTV|nr:hypothetical protein [Bacillus thuringiensis]OUC02370.1 hypothetical protein BK784_09585 [Bacillus thuringiensis serovar medellin]
MMNNRLMMLWKEKILFCRIKTFLLWINIKEAETIMFYFPNSVQNLLEKEAVAPYYFQTM